MNYNINCVTKKNNNGFTMACKYNQNPKVIDYLVNKLYFDIYHINDYDKDGFTMACNHNNVDVIKYFFETLKIDIDYMSDCFIEVCMKCLKCNYEMDVVEIVGCDGLEVEVCPTHGVWLDRGELKKLLGVDSKRNCRKKRIVKKKADRVADNILKIQTETNYNRAQQIKGM